MNADGGAGEAHKVGEHLGRFFSQLTLELDGVFFTFSNITYAGRGGFGLFPATPFPCFLSPCRTPEELLLNRLAVAAKTGEPVIDLQVTVRAERFPSLSQLKF
jgi:hypothetical protein